MAGVDGWNEWSKHVLKELERLNDCYASLLKAHGDTKESDGQRYGRLKTEIAILKVKSGMWGAIAGAVPSGIAAIIWYFGKG